MFMPINCRLHKDRNELAIVYFDASRVIKVTDVDVDKGCVFWFHDADVGGALPYDAPDFSAAALVEAVMECRMKPAEWLPSRNVGKAKHVEPSPGNHTFRAQDAKKD